MFFPKDERFHTSLLNRNSKVLSIGNLIHNPKVKKSLEIWKHTRLHLLHAL